MTKVRSTGSACAPNNPRPSPARPSPSVSVQTKHAASAEPERLLGPAQRRPWPASGKSEEFGAGGPADGASVHGPAPEPLPASADADALDPSLLLRALWRSDDAVHQLAYRHGATGGFSHIAVRDVDHAMDESRRLDAAGGDVYLACAEYLNTDSRKAENALGAFAVWADVDCGDEKAAAGKGYANLSAASAAIKAFCQEVGLPKPTYVVESGGGLQIYWVFLRRLENEAWKSHARSLKALCAAHGFLVDPSRSADIASVMRMPGTSNRKYVPARPVRLIKADAEYLDPDYFSQQLRHALGRGRPSSVGTSGDTPSTQTGGASDPPPDPARLESALRFIDCDCDDETWKLRVIAPMAREARVHPASACELKALAQRWSRGDLRGQPSTKWVTPGTGGKTGEQTFDAVWSRFLTNDYPGTPTTLGTVYHLAKDSGWEAPGEGFGRVEDAEIDDTFTGACETLEAMLDRVRDGDAGAPLEDKSIGALAVLRAHSLADYYRFRAELKKANGKVSLTAIDAAVDERLDKSTSAETHHGYAKGLLKQMTVPGNPPVAHGGALFVVDPASNLWVPKELDELTRLAAERFDGAPHCKRRADYQGVAQHAIAMAASPGFFEQAPIGIACPDGLIHIKDDAICREPLTAAHRQRVALGFSPIDQPTPLFDKFLHETFQSKVDGEEAEQTRLAQEIAGAIMVGLTARHHKAVLLYDPYGRAGKGTFVSILERLVPPEHVTAVSPFKWDREYYVAGLSGSRLNVVGELQDSDPIPAAPFKTIIGRDRVTGRNPAGRPFSFQNEATHVFMSNHLINTRDHTEAFFARWLLLEFPNSRIKLGLPVDADLAARIIASEMPGIAHWALQGARRLLRNGRFSSSAVHNRLMAKWRRSTSSVEEFIHEECDPSGDTSTYVKRSEFYVRYRTWCSENGRRPYSKAHVKELLEYNVALGVKLASLNGYEVFRGLAFRAEDPSIGL